MSGAAEFRLLGPLEVAVGGRLVQVNGRRQRELLAMLLVSANRLISLEALVDMAWRARAPATARRQIQNSVGRLRNVLTEGGVPPEVIETQPGGYVLRADGDGLDALAFTSRVAEGRQAAKEGRLESATAKLRGALALWRGKALAEFDADAISNEAARLEELRMAVLEECLELELRQGLHHDLIGELTALTREHPLRERLWSHLMLALYRDGRRADALAAYRQARHGFVAELGLDPGPELLRLETAVLAGDRSLDPPGGHEQVERPQPCQLPADVSDFTGRDDIARELEELFRRECEGHALPVVAIAGKAGVGKTALAVHVAHRLRDVCRDGQLYVNLGGLRDHRADPAEVLVRFLRALGTASTAIPSAIEERAEIFREQLADRRMLLVLDNAVDDAQIRPLLPGASGSAVLITSRSRLTGLSGARLVELDVLEAGDAAGMLARAVGEDRVKAEAAITHDLVRLCGRLPLALRIAGARLAARPHWTLERMVSRLTNERRRLDELSHGDLEVRASLSLSYRRLDPRSRRLLRLLGLLQAPDLTGWVCAALLDTTVQAAEELIDELIDTQLIDAAGQDAVGQTRYRFHDLVRLYARERAFEEESSSERVAAVTRALGGWMALVERAHRAVHGGDFAILHGTAPRWLSAVEELGDVIDAGPLAWYETERLNIVAGVRQAADMVLDVPEAGEVFSELCWDLAATAVSLFQLRGHYDDWEDVLTRSLAATRTAGNPRGTASMLTGLGWLGTYRHQYTHAATMLSEALSLFRNLGDDHGLALALPMAAHIDGMRGRYDEAIARHDEALRVLRKVGDHSAEIFVLRSIGQVLVEAGRSEQARPYLEQALAQSRERNPHARAEVLCWLGESYLASGDADRAEAMFLETLAIAEQIGDPRGEANARHGLGRIKLQTGASVAALELFHHALLLTARVGEGRLEARIRLSLGRLHHRRRNHDEAITQLTRSAQIFDLIDAPIWHAHALTALGEARRT
ncbi:BTAD domain-containing putative transcriptional regulator [Actinomadura sp. 6N118]|uniref:AfsR/SARP family transcriptional regulator n=1 Tax=Actinomadura sp. 6N118 TaxID=3375151 RepID=UPI0037A3EDC6